MPTPKRKSARGELFVGLMSGTSLDGIDAALIDFAPRPWRLVGTHFVPYPAELRSEALALASACDDELERTERLAVKLADAYAGATNGLLAAAAVEPRRVVAIGCHGQTVRHRPEQGFTVQLVNGARLVERTGIAVVTDFRSRDIAAGGQGAPLVPAFHRACFAREDVHRVIVNIGGIANLTSLPPAGPVIGFDTGPGNLLLDVWASRATGDDVDLGGRFAASGRVDASLLERFAADAYFQQSPPKSTGREHFNARWLERMLERANTAPADVQATLAELSARTIADGIDAYCAGASEVYVCGGGAHNTDLMTRLRAALGARRVESTTVLGVDPDWVEAFGFAWLARAALRGEPGNLAGVTGARGERVLGAIYPA